MKAHDVRTVCAAALESKIKFGSHFAQTEMVVPFAHFPVQARTRGVLWWG